MTEIVYISSASNQPEAAAAQIERWAKDHPQCGVWAMAAEKDASWVASLQAAANRQGVTLVGAIFPALIYQSRFYDGGVLLQLLPTMPPHLLAEGLELPLEALEPKVEQLAHQLKKAGGEESATLFLVFDAQISRIATILGGLYLALADRFQYAGVNAGSETFQPMACLFDNHRLVEKAMLALLLPSSQGALLNHGYQAPSDVVTATSSQNNQIKTIDWRPAFEVYRERVKAGYGVEITPENFYQYGVHYPFGLVLAGGDVLVRIPVALTGDGALFCVGEVPENAVLVMLDSAKEKLMEAVEQLALRIEREGWTGFSTFYCAGRRLHLGLEDAQLELERMAQKTGPVHGALSLGEIGSLSRQSYPNFHNGTLVCLQWKSK